MTFSVALINTRKCRRTSAPRYVHVAISKKKGRNCEGHGSYGGSRDISELSGFGRRCSLRAPGRLFHVHKRRLVSCSLLPSGRFRFHRTSNTDLGSCSLLPASRFTFQGTSKVDFGSSYSFLRNSRFLLSFPPDSAAVIFYRSYQIISPSSPTSRSTSRPINRMNTW